MVVLCYMGFNCFNVCISTNSRGNTIMYDFGKITFIQEHEDQKIVHEIRGDASMDEVVDAFEMFLKGAGYHLPDGKHIGYEYEGVAAKKEQYDAMDEMSELVDLEDEMLRGDHMHSKYYWDTERNR